VADLTDKLTYEKLQYPHFLKPIEAMEITEQLLIENGFDKMAVTSWCGNGYDYQLPPEDGGSRTKQTDFVMHNAYGDSDFIVRFTEYDWGGKNKEDSISFHLCEWYPKCLDEIHCFDPTKIENLQAAFKLSCGRELVLKNVAHTAL